MVSMIEGRPERRSRATPVRVDYLRPSHRNEESPAPVALWPVMVESFDKMQAECLARSFLVGACEQALFDLLCTAGEAKCSEDVRISLMASDLIRETLSYWRNQMEVARAAAQANVGDRR